MFLQSGELMSKKKKEKIIYYDDNSTIADMSSVTKNGKKEPQRPKVQSTFRDQWKTYWSAVKMMLLPMCIALSALAIIYLVIMLTSGNM